MSDHNALPVRRFHDAESSTPFEALQAWRRDNPHGFLLNLASGTRATLHKTECQHLGDNELGRQAVNVSTQTPKVCSNDRAALIEWTQARGTAVVACNHCKPD